MRVFAIASIAILSLGQAQAQDKDTDKEQQPKLGSCFYMIQGRSYEVPAGVRLCWRSPAPYQDQYSLQVCGPPLNEIALVRRGDPRCERYEERQ